MKIIIKKYLPHLLALFLLVSPLIVFAASSGATIKNPLKSDDVNSLLGKIMTLVKMVGGIVVVFFIILSGYKIVTAGDNEGDRTKAKEMFYATVIGGAILLGASIIAEVVVNTVKDTTGAK
jgi:ABC-type Fe3+-siderophore transport system permease subunit